MPKGSSGAGQGTASASSDARDYSGLDTFANTSAYRPGEQGPNFVSEANPLLRISVSPVTGGSERQNEWATNIKTQQMRKMDAEITQSIKNANAAGNTRLAQLYVQARSEVMRNINATNNPQQLIGSRDTSAGRILQAHISQETRERIQTELERLNRAR